MKKDKKMVSGFTPELEQAIREDIEKGQKALADNSPSTHALYREIQSKYLQLYPHLCDGIVSRVSLAHTKWNCKYHKSAFYGRLGGHRHKKEKKRKGGIRTC